MTRLVKFLALPTLCLATILAAGMTLPEAAQAAEASAFFRQFEGRWKGGGKVKRSLDAKPIRIRCDLQLKLNESGKKLENSGRCATTSGKSKVKGAISFSSSGNRLTGAFLRQYANTRVLKSSGSFSDKAMTLNATHQDTNTDKVSKSRTIISKPRGRKFQASIYEFDRSRQAYIRIGELVFKR